MIFLNFCILKNFVFNLEMWKNTLAGYAKITLHLLIGGGSCSNLLYRREQWHSRISVKPEYLLKAWLKFHFRRPGIKFKFFNQYVLVEQTVKNQVISDNRLCSKLGHWDLIKKWKNWKNGVRTRAVQLCRRLSDGQIKKSYLDIHL